MKLCTYCGRDNEDAATHCSECATELPATVAEAEPVQPRDSGTLKTFVTIVGVLFLGITLYLLSFGPVFRWTATVTTTRNPVALTNTFPVVGTIFITESTSYPTWVGVVYFPATSLMYGNAGLLSDLYHRYIEWWKKTSP